VSQVPNRHTGKSEHDISDLAQISVIIVDDDEAVRDSLSVMLMLAGLQVEACASCAACLSKLEDYEPDCLVVDLHMPQMTGLEMIEKLYESGRKIPAILISGNLDDATRVTADKIGISTALKKPFSGDQLVAAIRGLFG
jgi:two-component system response regulator FixJ